MIFSNDFDYEDAELEQKVSLVHLSYFYRWLKI